MSTTLNYCTFGGSLVAIEYWLPIEPHDSDLGGRAGPIGCNQIVCTQCGDRVRHFDGCQVAEGQYLQAAELHDVADWRGCAKLVAFAPARLYCCACSVRQCFGFEELQPPPDSMRSPGPWTCGGHPPLPPSVELDGIPIGPQTDWQALVDEWAEGRLPVRVPWPAGMAARWPALWLYRLCALVESPQVRHAIGLAATQHLASDDAEQLNRVAQLFYMDPTLPGGRAVALTLKRRGADLWHMQQRTGRELYFAMLWTVGRLALLTDLGAPAVPEAVEAAKAELLAGRPSLALLHAIAAADSGWLQRNLHAIADAHPADVETIALSLHGRDRALWQPHLLRLGQRSTASRQAVLAALARTLGEDDLRHAAEAVQVN